MAQGTFYKTFGSSDRTTTRTLLHEAIPVTGTLVTSGSHSPYEETNVRNFAHGMFQSVYDYPFLSSSANHLFDITVGVQSGSTGDFESVTNMQEKKGNIYSQMAQVLMGYDTDGNVRSFDEDGNLDGGDKIQSAIFFNFSRLLVKDEIKKGSFEMILGANNTFSVTGEYDQKMKIYEISGSDGYFVNSPAGEYGVLASGQADTDATNVSAAETPVGLIFYQAGVVVLDANFISDAKTSNYDAALNADGDTLTTNNGQNADAILDMSIEGIASGIRNRIVNLSFNNTTELNSTVYFCRANHNEFNYSSNPTYLDGSKIRVKNNDIMVPPRTYVTTVGLYSADNELLAVAKLSEPLRKDPTNELTLRVRLDY